MRRLARILVIASCVMVVTSASSRSEPPAKRPSVDFNREILPILSDKCFRCHGPDRQQRKGGLRLDRREDALADHDGRRAITAGTPDASEAFQRITTDDDDERMPPANSGLSLSASEIQVLKSWIEQGARYQPHWSFVPPESSPIPAVANPAWPGNPVDSFILAELERHGLKPAAEAPRTGLLRRVTLDLTGLPPSPAEVEAFLADKRPDAYERAVDRLLASAHYGEKMAVEWLDAARYADTHGFHIDSHRDMWPWRAWVIQAFNTNLPFDQFTLEQLAGDLLPKTSDPVVDQRRILATGFLRNHMINFEGGAIPEEYHNAYIVDRVNTAGTVWLGLSVNCAQCHDHKYDPISQRDYYRLYAFFHNVPENGLDGRKGNAAPLLALSTPAEAKRTAELTQRITALTKALTEPDAPLDTAQAAWEKTAVASSDVKWTPLKPKETESLGESNLSTLSDGSVRADLRAVLNDTYIVTAIVDQPGVRAFRLEGIMENELRGRGPGRSQNGNFVLTDFRCETAPANDPTALTPAPFRTATADFSQEGFPITAAIDGNKRSGWAVLPEVKKGHSAVFELAQPLGAKGSTLVRITLAFDSEFPEHLLGRFRLDTTSAANPHALALPDPIKRLLAVSPAKRTAEQTSELRRYYRSNYPAQQVEAARELAGLEREKAELDLRIPTAMVMEEMGKPRDTFVLSRGQYDKPLDRVVPGVPDVLLPLPGNSPPNRLGLARWLLDPQHPLTARVTVNRVWQMVFGTGIVKTAEDFGLQGERPSHPALLDYLASDFAANGWDVKRLVRMLVTSAAYRQRSAVSPELLAKDPENRLLARGPRRRLAAEFIRDQALAVAGLLDQRIGGPSVFPYQPNDLWNELAYGGGYSAQVYTPSRGADLYRRSMYTFWKRTIPPPQLNAFDAPDRETCTVRRSRTNTPLQALVLLNDPTYVEAARKLAERVITTAGSTPQERTDALFQIVLARVPRAAERAVVERIFQEQLAAYRRDPAAARQLLAVGESPWNETLDPAELAAWAMAAALVLNLDETVNEG